MEAGNYTMKTARRSRDVIIESLEGTAKDHFGALSVRPSWDFCTVACSSHRRTARDADAVTSPKDSEAGFGVRVLWSEVPYSNRSVDVLCD